MFFVKNKKSILIVAATFLEVSSLIKKFQFLQDSTSMNYFIEKENIICEILITGVGASFTIFELMKKIYTAPQKYNLIINIGIAGSFAPQVALSEVVQIIQDEFADLGIEDGKKSFQTIFEANFSNPNEYPFSNGKLIPENLHFENIISLPQKKAITVNLAHGNIENIEFFKNKFYSDVESMEGAAVFYVCMKENIPVLQIRSISNYVEPRNKENWKLKESLESLTTTMIKILENLNN
jgi:futalosine hydrolase